jgi:hypothetical protein
LRIVIRLFFSSHFFAASRLAVVQIRRLPILADVSTDRSRTQQ